MLTIRKAGERGRGDHGWLTAYHTFSFAGYHDPRYMGFRSLRVINEDRVAPGMGFETHPHRDMEIITVVLAGSLEHKDSLGHGAVLRPGEAQSITAGTGISHSEFNPSASEVVHLYQIWLVPDRKGYQPHYDQRDFPLEGRENRWQLIATSDGREKSMVIQQDATVALGNLAVGQTLRTELASGRHAWIQVLRGTGEFEGQSIAAGDGVAIADETSFSLKTTTDKLEVMLFDLP